eukprot:CAMPEP_0117574322 /NCGR_PEP_ID=MMETSP0784-20121206/61507_1 /TAXON_ID=39447 /ORGANISM="" /LENGTH=61 /DNA_ID=CAMNT_0005373109 /DNA_START=27 /DNA_END=209 /DNA_ORIENTATION=-
MRKRDAAAYAADMGHATRACDVEGALDASKSGLQVEPPAACHSEHICECQCLTTPLEVIGS